MNKSQQEEYGSASETLGGMNQRRTGELHRLVGVGGAGYFSFWNNFQRQKLPGIFYPCFKILWHFLTPLRVTKTLLNPSSNQTPFSCFPHLAVVQLLSRVCLFVTPWTVACQAPLSMNFSRQEYWSGLPFPSPIFKEPMKTPQQRRGQLGYLFSLLSFLWTSLWVTEQLRKMGESAKKADADYTFLSKAGCRVRKGKKGKVLLDIIINLYLMGLTFPSTYF